jgi:hypothetical protein
MREVRLLFLWVHSLWESGESCGGSEPTLLVFPYGKIPFWSEASNSEALSKELDYKIVQVMITT